MFREYLVDNYSINCEENAKIKKIICLKFNIYKYIFIVWFLNILTIFFIQIIFKWFPNLEILLSYSSSNSPLEATHYGVYDNQTNSLLIVKNKIITMNHDNDRLTSLKNNFDSNLFTQQNIRIFEYKLYNYLFNELTNEFESLKFELMTQTNLIKKEFSRGISNYERNFILETIGKCLIEININSVADLVIIEISDPFYLFQFFSFSLWIFIQENYLYAVIIMLMTILSITLAIYETLLNMKSMKKIAEHSCLINRFNNEDSRFEEVESTQIAPGDIIEIPNIEGFYIPCDCILLSGTVVMNESILTGESVPVIKTDLAQVNTTEIFNPKNNSSLQKHLILTGTKVVFSRNNNKSNYEEFSSGKTVAVAYKTGFYSEKGNLIRSILNPQDSVSEFKKESNTYIMIILVYALILSILTLPYMTVGNPVMDRIYRAFDYITIGIPANIPACLSIAIGIAIEKMKALNIVCMKREKTNICGKVNYIVFDKTGTLTSDCLEELGDLRVNINNISIEFGLLKTANNCKKSLFDNLKRTQIDYVLEFNQNYKFNSNLNLIVNYLFEECLATCHTLQLFDGKIIGDPIEKEMLRNINWQILDTTVHKVHEQNCFLVVHPKNFHKLKIGIVKYYDFINKLQRMTVITKCLVEEEILKPNNLYKVFTKGAPEKIKSMCKLDSIPNNFDFELKTFTSIGLRVLAFAGKIIETNDINSYSREEAENNLVFLGFYIVQNPLKKETKEEIELLKNSGYDISMATGDNILTASYIAHKCSISNKNIVSIELNESTNNVNVVKFDYKEADEICQTINYKNQKTIINSNSIINVNDNDLYTDNEDFKFISKEKKEFELLNLNTETNKNKSPSTLNFDDEIFNEKTIKLINNLLLVEKDLNSLTNNINNDDDSIQKTNNNEIDHKYNINKNQAKVTEVSYTKNKNAVDFINNISEIDNDNYVFAIDGNIFELLITTFNSNLNYNNDSKSKIKEKRENNIKISKIIKKTLIFARMTPDNKAQLVSHLKVYNKTVLMCGDGANDCGALKAADIGLSLSLEEASIAAPFTSLTNSISSVKTLLIEGKACLNTSITCFKYIMMIAILEVSYLAFLTYKLSYFSPNQFLLTDLCVVIPYTILIGITKSKKEINNDMPTYTLYSSDVLFSMLLQLFTLFICTANCLFILQQFGWYVPDKAVDNVAIYLMYPGYLNTVRLKTKIIIFIFTFNSLRRFIYYFTLKLG